MRDDRDDADRLAEACDRLEDLLLRYNELAAGQLNAIRAGNIKAAHRMAVTAESVLMDCQQAERRVATARAAAPRSAGEHQSHRLRALAWAADATARQLGSELTERRSQLLAEIGRLGASSSESSERIIQSYRANLINIKT